MWGLNFKAIPACEQGRPRLGEANSSQAKPSYAIRWLTPKIAGRTKLWALKLFQRVDGGLKSSQKFILLLTKLD